MLVQQESRYLMLRTNIEFDEKLVEEAMMLTRKKTNKELVNYALRELVSKMRMISPLRR